ncbi:hypothetical protein Q8A73_013497 [Channa argus]|nr:hypothetical protein Q8A73_013497 [Channa argus]
MRPYVSLPGLVETQNSLRFSWKDFDVSQEIFFRDLEFLDSLAIFWKCDPDFAGEVAFYKLKYVPWPFTFQEPNSRPISHQPPQPEPVLRAPASSPVPVSGLPPAPFLLLIPAASPGSDPVPVSEWYDAASTTDPDPVNSTSRLKPCCNRSGMEVRFGVEGMPP